jgi:PRTRC genetic system protein B
MHPADFTLHVPAGNVLRLARAVLLYQGHGGDALATVHDIKESDGVPVIGAGRAMGAQTARSLALALLQRAAPLGFLPETVLCQHGDLLLWWAPPARRHIVLRVDAAHAEALGGAERGEAVPHPGLVFAASGRAWQVWAVKGRRRPTPKTPLFQAPYFNVDGAGRICQGNVPVPDGTTVDRLGAWNDAFWHSTFTHPNVRGPLVRYPGGAHVFWRDLLDQRFQRFPERVLVDASTTLGALITALGKT